MALTRCGECGREVSTKASACPHCGARAPVADRLARAVKYAAVAVGLLLLVVTASVFLLPRALDKAAQDMTSALQEASEPAPSQDR